MNESESAFEKTAREEREKLDQTQARGKLTGAVVKLLCELVEAKYPLTHAVLSLNTELVNEAWRYSEPAAEKDA